MRVTVAFLLAAVSCLGLACGKSSRENRRAPAAAGSSGSGGAAQSAGGSAGTDATNGGSDEPGAGGDGASEGGQGPEVTLSPVELDGSPIYTRVQRLTNSQWERAVTDLLRFGEARNLSQNFALPVVGASEFTNNERVLYVGGREFLDYESAAEAAAALATGTPEALAAVDAGGDAAGFIRTFGRRAFRRPLSDTEAAKYEELFAVGEALYGAGFANGAALVIRGMLQSPHFLYRTELGPAGDPLTGYEVAAKLSFWLLGTTPSDALLDSAERGELDGADGVESAARAMLETPEALAVMRDFHGQLHHLGAFASVVKEGVPEHTPELNVELAEASYLFFDGVFAENQGYREILTSTRAFVGPGLAPLYGIDPAPSALEARDVGSSRGGFYLQVPFLLLRGVREQPDTAERGAVLIDRVLCANTDDEAAWSVLGRAFDGFDGMGRAREAAGVDTSGSFGLAEGDKEFSDGRELLQILSETEQAHTCYAKMLSGYALQRDLVEGDRPLLEGLAQTSLTESLKAMILSLVRDPEFRARKEGTL